MTNSGLWQAIKAVSVVTVLAASSGNVAIAQPAASDFPNRPITWITPFSTGGQLDVVSRALAKPLEKHLGQPVVVKNVSGGGGTVGLTEISHAEPDGYTVGLAPISMLSLSPHRIDVSYDVDSFDYFSVWGNMPMGIAVVKSSPYQSLDALLEHAKDNRVTVVNTAPGGAQSLLLHLMNSNFETQLVEVPAAGGGEGVSSVLGGHTEAIISNPSILTGGSDLQLLASLSRERWPNRPDVPTAEEQGFSLPTTDIYVTTVGPSGMPADVVDKWNSAISAAVEDPEFVEIAARFAMLLVKDMSGDDFKRVAEEQYEEFGPIIETLK